MTHTNAQLRKTSMHAGKVVVISSQIGWIHFIETWRATTKLTWRLLQDILQLDVPCVPPLEDAQVDHTWFHDNNYPKFIQDVITCFAMNGNISSVTGIVWETLKYLE